MGWIILWNINEPAVERHTSISVNNVGYLYFQHPSLYFYFWYSLTLDIIASFIQLSSRRFHSHSFCLRVDSWFSSFWPSFLSIGVGGSVLLETLCFVFVLLFYKPDVQRLREGNRVHDKRGSSGHQPKPCHDESLQGRGNFYCSFVLFFSICVLVTLVFHIFF